MKIALIGESPHVPTGFGTVDRFLCKYFTELGHDVNMISWQDFGSPVLCFDSGDALATAISGDKPEGCYKIWPMWEQKWGFDCIPHYIKEIQPDIVFSLADVWMDGIQFLAKQNWLRRYRWVHYCPIDGAPVPREWLPTLHAPKELVAMSRFGQEELAKVDMDVKYVWHGVETKYWKPYPFKEKSGYKDKFVVYCASRNQPRKELTRVLRIAKYIKNNYPSKYKNMYFHFHTDPYDPVGLPLIDIANELEVGKEAIFTKKLRSYSEGVSLKNLISITNCCDVHLLPTTGEGFGLTIAETMACGLPNLVTDYTTTRELVTDKYPGIGPRGEAIELNELVHGSRGVYRGLADIKDAAEKIVNLYDDENLKREYGKNAVKFAQNHLDWEKSIIPQWQKIFGQTPDGDIILEEL